MSERYPEINAFYKKFYTFQALFMRKSIDLVLLFVSYFEIAG